MIISTKKPFGAISDKAIQYRFEQDNKFYVMDNGYNPIEISESDYMRLTCPIKKYGKKVR